MNCRYSFYKHSHSCEIITVPNNHESDVLNYRVKGKWPQVPSTPAEAWGLWESHLARWASSAPPWRREFMPLFSCVPQDPALGLDWKDRASPTARATAQRHHAGRDRGGYLRQTLHFWARGWVVSADTAPRTDCSPVVSPPTSSPWRRVSGRAEIAWRGSRALH